MSDNPGFKLNDDGSISFPDGSKVEDLKTLGEGFMRQGDYTRKTQDLALQRKEVETAASLMTQLEINPAKTLRSLAEKLDVDLMPPVAAAPAPVRQQDDWDSGNSWDNTGPTDPPQSVQEDPRITQLVEAVTNLQNQLGTVAGNQAKNSVQAEMDKVVARLQGDGIEVDPAALIRFAKGSDILNLDAAATVLYQDDIVTARAAKLAEDKTVTDSKRSASQAIKPGAGPASDGSTEESSADGKMGLREALESTLVELGVDDFSSISFDAEPTSPFTVQ